MGKIKALEARKDLKQQVSVEDVKQPPVFMTPLRDIGVIAEGSNVAVEAKIEPKSDPNLKVEWELNGTPLQTGSRIQTKLDFGHVILKIDGARASDSGFYTCKAINALGEAVSTTSVKVEGKKIILLFCVETILRHGLSVHLTFVANYVTQFSLFLDHPPTLLHFDRDFTDQLPL